MLKKIYLYFIHTISFLISFLSLPSLLFLHLCSLLSTDPNAISSLSSFSGCGFWLCPELKRGCGSWLGPLWVVGCGSAWLWVSGGCGSTWLWVVARRGCGLWVVDWRGCGLWAVDRRGWLVVVDRRAGMKWVVGRGSAAEGGCWSWIGG